MKNLSLTLLCNFFALVLSAQTEVPAPITQMANEYTTLLRTRDFNKAVEYLHPNMEYAMTKEAWLRTQESTVNSDMSLRTNRLSIDQAATTVKQIADHTYYLFVLDEQLEARIENENASKELELADAIMTDFSQQFGSNNVQKIDASSFTIERKHHLMMLPLADDATQFRIVDFPDGRIDQAYGILPAGIWPAFFPDRELADRMRYIQAVPQTVGHYFQLLKAKQYDNAAMLIMDQEAVPGPFMNWYKSLDNETTVLSYVGYQLTTPVRIKLQDGKRYAGFGLQFTLTVGLTADEPAPEDISATRELLAKGFPNMEITFDESANQFTFDVFSPVIGVADTGKNNWKLLLDDPANGMSIKDNISDEIQRGAGLN